jgi:hypothetical protein
MRALAERYKAQFSSPSYVLSVLLSAVLFIVALFVNFWAIAQATKRAGPGVPDLILSNIPVYEVDGFFVYGTFLVILYTAIVVFSHPNRIPFALHGLTLFILIRSAFSLMTHLGPPQVEYTSDFGETITRAFFGADQFFSAHTGMPFLGVLAFWHIHRKVALGFLAASLYFAVVVLLGHIHYTIDVASAFFITYGIFQVATYFLKRDWELFNQKS